MKERFFRKGTMLSRHPLGAKLVSFALVAMLVVTMMPASAFFASEETAEKVTDISTINEWKDYFTNPDMGTEYAGGVWTDKSVFNSGSDFDNALSKDEAETGIRTDEDNFLVAMSALATNKEIVGYSTYPTDTIFVLDLSNSMDKAKSVPDMVKAANDAIDALLKLNKNNRVGIVLYSGNSKLGNADANTGKVLLELNRYKANGSGEYITYSGQNDDTTVKTADRLQYENGKSVNPVSKETDGGTYIQNGLYIAMKQFLAAEPVVEEDNIQGGETRIPIFVLMSDGAPTVATTSYTGGSSSMGTSNIGNGSASSEGIGFVTQLTAAYAREMTEMHYGTEPKFYTLGLNLGGTTGQPIASSVMNPKTSTNAINQYWNSLFTDGTVKFDGNTVKRPTKSVDGQTVYIDYLERDDQYYVDKYFDASSNEKLESAFADIVAEIILQSAYYPTYIENRDRDLSGYVSFYDEIGHFMEVKSVKGILLGDKLFTGETLAKMMAKGEFGNAQTFTDKGWELVESFAERIGVDQSTAITLLQNAWRDGQLYYNSATDYDNYIGWYEGANSEYIGFWSQKDGAGEEQAAVDKGAKYITKSYGYYGSNTAGDSIVGSDMMHVVVKVRTEIETGLQTVIFEVPASLIPVITYDITLDTDSYDTAKDITMEIGEETPIRLLFEVGLTDEINEYNMQEIMSAEGVHSHPVLDENDNPTGEYYFYTNVWGYGKDQTELAPQQHEVAESVFTPSTDNEHYYYTEDAIIYVKTGENTYTPYTDEKKPEGDDYYRAYRAFKLTGQGDAAEMSFVYEKIAAETFSYNDGENIAKNEDGQWYVKAGAVRRTLDSYHIEKLPQGTKGGLTETLRYSRYAVIQPSEDDLAYAVYSFQGNNGRLKMAPATGIKLTKQVDNTIADANIVYGFKIELANGANGEFTMMKDNVETQITFENGVNVDPVELKAGETAYIVGLPAGNYTVTEVIGADADYKVDTVSVDGVEEDGTVAADTIEVNVMDFVVFTNTESKDGDLVVRKNVTNDYPDAAEKVNTKEFTINVKLTDFEGKALAEGTKFKSVQGTTEKTVTLGEGGTFSVKLKHNESITIKDVPEGTKYVVTETNLPDGFYLNTNEADLTGTIVNKGTSIVTVVNDYRPGGAPENGAIEISLNKTIDGREWKADDAFKFQLEKMNADGTWGAVGESKNVTQSNKSVSFRIGKQSLTTVGTHYFRVNEVNANKIPGITNDTAKYFTIAVTETDGDGYLEIASITPGADVTVGSNNSSIDINFVNTYTTKGEAAVNIPIEKHLINDTNVGVSLEGFVFELKDGNDDVVAEKTTNMAGEAIIHLTYTADQFNALDTDHNNVVELKYNLSEKKDGKANVIYDSAEYDVTVVLTSDDGKLTADMTMKKADATAATAVFTNTFDISDSAKASFQLTAKKELKGRDLKTGEFKFNLYETGADFVVAAGADPVADGVNDANGNIEFDAVSYEKAGTYYYVAKEVVPEDTEGVTYSGAEYYVTVTVTYDETEKKLVASETIVKPGTGVITEENVKFINEYNVEPTSVRLTGTKELTGKDLTNGEFTFVIIDKDGKEVVTTTNTSAVGNSEGIATGTFIFPAIEYTDAGTYEYTVVEQDAEKTGYTYDDTVYKVEVTVKDNGDGTLTAAPVVKIDDRIKDGIVFENVYEPEPTSVAFTATKQLENRDLKAGEFGFSVYSADADFNEGNDVVASGTNTADGTISFDSIEIKDAGTYYYVMKENIPAEDSESFDTDVVYDPIEYHITVVAWDMGGKLNTRVTYTANGVPAAQMYFSNVYFEPTPASIDLGVTKVLHGRDLERGEFEFQLYEADADFNEGKILETAKNGENVELNEGVVLFKSLTYDALDLGGADSKDFYYVIKEVVPADADKEGVVYDDSYFNVKVTVTNNGDGELIATKSIEEVDGDDADAADNSKVEFNNTYSAAEAALTLGGTKTLENKNLGGGDFTFALYKTDETYVTDGLDAIDTAANNADGKFAFGQLTFDKEGTFYYVVAEVAGDDAGTADGEVAYDATEYRIKVVVSDNGNGELELDITYDKDSVLTDQTAAVIDNLNFKNGYNPVDAKINLAGTKVLEGRELAAGAFTFELYETSSDYKVAENAEPVQTKVNDENDRFTFDTIVYDTLAAGAEETHYYVVKEHAPADKNGVTYDLAEYHIKAVVKNDGNGNLSQVVTIDGKEYTDATVVLDALDFKNSYHSELPEGVGLSIEGRKNLLGDRTTVGAGEFTFTLSEVTDLGDGNVIVEELDKTTAGAGGGFRFDRIDTFEEPGTYNYRVTENAGDVEGMTYDKTVYDVTVEVIDNGEGDLVIKEPVYKVGDTVVKDIEFNNNYDDPTPDEAVQTGDTANLSLYVLLMLMALTGMAAATIRRRTN